MNEWKYDPYCDCVQCRERRKPKLPTVLDEARECVDISRQNNYGSPKNNFTGIGIKWGADLAALPDWKKGDPIPPRIVALLMVDLKVIRDCFKPLRDNLVDGCGYFYAASKLEDKDE